MASLRKFENSKNFYCCFTLPTGQRVQRSTGTWERKKAEAIALDWQRAVDLAKAGEFADEQSRRILNRISEVAGLQAIHTVKTRGFLEEWIQSKEVTKAAGTSRRYKHTVDGFLNSLGERADKSLATVGAADVSRFRDQQIKEGKSASTANMALKTLRIVFNSARRRGLISTNPAEAIEPLEVSQGERQPFSRQQISSLLEVADPEWRGMILIGACHGLRLGDVARLTWSNYNPARDSLVYFPQKRKRSTQRKPVEVPLHADVSAYLGSLPAGDDPKSPLFPSFFDKRLSGTGGLSLQFRRLMHRAGIYTEGEGEERRKGKGRRFFEQGFHSFRHTATSEMANRGVNKEIRMKLVDHKSDVHERYTHLELGALRVEIGKVPSFVK